LFLGTRRIPNAALVSAEILPAPSVPAAADSLWTSCSPVEVANEGAPAFALAALGAAAFASAPATRELNPTNGMASAVIATASTAINTALLIFIVSLSKDIVSSC
jgi:hypothetical protein